MSRLRGNSGLAEGGGDGRGGRVCQGPDARLGLEAGRRPRGSEASLDSQACGPLPARQLLQPGRRAPEAAPGPLQVLVQSGPAPEARGSRRSTRSLLPRGAGPFRPSGNAIQTAVQGLEGKLARTLGVLPPGSKSSRSLSSGPCLCRPGSAGRRKVARSEGETGRRFANPVPSFPVLSAWLGATLKREKLVRISS